MTGLQWAMDDDGERNGKVNVMAAANISILILPSCSPVLSDRLPISLPLLCSVFILAHPALSECRGMISRFSLSSIAN